MIKRTRPLVHYASNENGTNVSRHTFPVGNLEYHGWLVILKLMSDYTRYRSYLMLIDNWYISNSESAYFRVTAISNNGIGQDYNPTISYDGSNLIVDIGNGTASFVAASFLYA